MKAEISTEIAAPPVVVFATLMDVARWPEFIKGITRIELLDPGPIREGTRLRETRTMYGREAVEVMTFAVIAPQRIVLTAENHGTRYTATHNIAASGAGSRLTLTFEGVAVTFAARLFSVLALVLAGSVRKQLARDLADVKAEAERRVTADAGR